MDVVGRVPIRRFLIWLRYDGSRFPEMARGGTGYGILDLLQQVLSTSIYGSRTSSEYQPLKLSPSSRTDAGVHALRNAVIFQVPARFSPKLLQNLEEYRHKWNEVIERVVPGQAMEVIDVHPVSAGFCCRRNVSYRTYTYRLAIAKDWELWKSLYEDPSVECFSEKRFAWLLPPGIDINRLQNAAKLFEGEHVMGSFYKHTNRDKRNETEPPSAIRCLLHVGLSKGEPYAMQNELYDYINISITAKSYLREQIRRMVSCVVYHGYDRLPLSTVQWLLKNPISSNFYDLRLPIAPPNGLFLSDVVYDKRMFYAPVPYHKHSWDYDYDFSESNDVEKID